MKAYKLVWRDKSTGLAHSAMFGRDGGFRTATGRLLDVQYASGDWAVPAEDTKFLFAFKSIEACVRFGISIYGGGVTGDILKPSPFAVKPVNRYKGHLEVWQVEITKFKYDKEDVVLLPRGTVLATRIKLLNQVKQLDK